MNGGSLGRVDGSPLINGVTNNVDDSAKSFLADRDSDGGAGVEDLKVKIIALSYWIMKQNEYLDSKNRDIRFILKVL